MILVTCGTQTQPFPRLFEAVENVNVDQAIIMQLGHTKFNTKHQHYDFSPNFSDDYDQAQVIITHGGVGSIMPGLLAHKIVIVMPRLAKYREHVDDHQLEITNKLQKEGYIYVINDSNELQSLLDNLDNLQPKIYESNNANFNQQFIEIVNKL